MKRGDVWWAELQPPAGRRPVVLVSRNEAYAIRASVTVAPVTTKIRNIPVEVPLGQQDGMPRDCVVNCDNLITIPKAWLQETITTLNVEKMDLLDKAIRFSLNL